MPSRPLSNDELRRVRMKLNVLAVVLLLASVAYLYLVFATEWTRDIPFWLKAEIALAFLVLVGYGRLLVRKLKRGAGYVPGTL